MSIISETTYLNNISLTRLRILILILVKWLSICWWCFNVWEAWVVSIILMFFLRRSCVKRLCRSFLSLLGLFLRFLLLCLLLQPLYRMLLAQLNYHSFTHVDYLVAIVNLEFLFGDSGSLPLCMMVSIRFIHLDDILA